MGNIKSDIDTKRGPSKHVLVFLVDAPRRPYVSYTGCIETTRPADWSEFGVEAWHAEIERRASLARLMTEDERKFFDKYCRLRDE